MYNEEAENISKNSRVQDEYEIKRILGEGTFGTVYLVRHRKTRELRAIKEINKNKLEIGQRKQVLYENHILKDLVSLR